MWAPQENKNKTKIASRICIANLLVIARMQDWHQLSNDLGQLAPKFPTRTIVVLIQDDQNTGQDTETVHAGVSAVCHIPQPDRPQVCSEQIILRCHSRTCQNLDRTILPLLAPDVPLMVWLKINPFCCTELLYQMQLIADKLILDAGTPGFCYLEPIGKCTTRELGWYRTAQRRELVAQIFDQVDRISIDNINFVAIAIDGLEQNDWIDACWLIAFLAGQLQWKPQQILDKGDFLFASKKQEIHATIAITQPIGSGMRSLTVTGPNESYLICRNPQRHDLFRIIIKNERVCRLPRSVQIHQIHRGRVLPAAFNEAANNPLFERAAPLAKWMNAYPGIK